MSCFLVIHGEYMDRDLKKILKEGNIDIFEKEEANGAKHLLLKTKITISNDDLYAKFRNKIQIVNLIEKDEGFHYLDKEKNELCYMTSCVKENYYDRLWQASARLNAIKIMLEVDNNG